MRSHDLRWRLINILLLLCLLPWADQFFLRLPWSHNWRSWHNARARCIIVLLLLLQVDHRLWRGMLRTLVTCRCRCWKLLSTVQMSAKQCAMMGIPRRCKWKTILIYVLNWKEVCYLHCLLDRLLIRMVLMPFLFGIIYEILHFNN